MEEGRLKIKAKAIIIPVAPILDFIETTQNVPNLLFEMFFSTILSRR